MSTDYCARIWNVSTGYFFRDVHTGWAKNVVIAITLSTEKTTFIIFGMCLAHLHVYNTVCVSTVYVVNS